MAATAMLNPVKEGRFILPGCDRRPADVFLPNWAAGRDAALDITVINPLQQATLEGAAREPGHALDFACQRKIAGVGEDCDRQGVAFLLLAFESLGGWHSTAENENLQCTKLRPLFQVMLHNIIYVLVLVFNVLFFLYMFGAC